MKKGLSLAMVYIGLIIGAGFASGREILTYFNLPTSTHPQGVALATVLLVLVCYLILRKCNLWGLTNCEEYYAALSGKFAPWIKRFLLLYLFCGFFTMLSGCGALLSESFMLPPLCGILLLTFLSFLFLVFDLKGIVSLNVVLVPCMLLGIGLLCIQTILLKAQPTFSMGYLTGPAAFSALCYVSYNTLSAPSVLVPLQKGLSSKELTFASLCGGLVLGIFIFLIWLCQGLHLEGLIDSPIPLLHLATLLGKKQKQLYTLILFMAILTTAVSQGFGILAHFPAKSKKGRLKHCILLCLFALPFALIDFSALVAYLYGFFGFCGLLWMAWLFVDFFWKKPL